MPIDCLPWRWSLDTSGLETRTAMHCCCFFAVVAVAPSQRMRQLGWSGFGSRLLLGRQVLANVRNRPVAADSACATSRRC